MSGSRPLGNHVDMEDTTENTLGSASWNQRPGLDIAAAWRQVARTLAEQESGTAGAEARAALEADGHEELAVACLFIKWAASRAPFDLTAMMADFDDFVATQRQPKPGREWARYSPKLSIWARWSFPE
jgi:hypothetical protein